MSEWQINERTVKNKGIGQLKKPSPLYFEEMTVKKIGSFFLLFTIIKLMLTA
jgi:hypothetical protein